MKSPLKCHKSRFVKIWMISVWESGFWFCSLTLKIDSFLNCNLLGDSLSLPCYKIKQQLISLLLLSRSLQCSKNDHFLWYSTRLRINSTYLKLPGKASIFFINCSLTLYGFCSRFSFSSGQNLSPWKILTWVTFWLTL